MRVAFFHGLESKPRSEKNIFLEKTFDEVYAPEIDYNCPNCFSQINAELQEFKPDLLIGSSMGGYFAYVFSTIYNVPTLLFNPAVIDRSIDPQVTMGTHSPEQLIILGENDKVILPNKVISWFDGLPQKNFSIYWEPMGHRIPIKTFKKWVLQKTNDLTK